MRTLAQRKACSTVVDFPTITGDTFYCSDDDGGLWKFTTIGDSVLAKWDIPTDVPNRSNIGHKRFTQVNNFIEVFEHLLTQDYLFKSAGLSFPHADH
jgi:hypothetical protein